MVSIDRPSVSTIRQRNGWQAIWRPTPFRQPVVAHCLYDAILLTIAVL
jgi:hypothetical protein